MQLPNPAPPTPRRAPPWWAFLRSRSRRDLLLAWLLIAPALIVLGAVVFVPVLEGVRYSFLEYTIRTRRNPQWNAFGNYLELIRSGDLRLYLVNTFVFVAAVVGIQFVLALIASLLLNTDIKGRNVLRGLFLIPWTVPTVVVAMLWLWMLQPQFGVVNYLLGDVLGVVRPNQVWTQHPQLAMVSVVMASVWRQTPLMLVMLLAGLQGIPQNLIEAARIDGAGSLRVTRHIVLPLLRPVMGATVLLAIITNFQMFVIIFVMTQGGPVDRTATLSIGTYREAFSRFDTGSGAAIGVVWLGILIAITLLYNRFVTEGER